jgi:outer membrane cobalamin receptor
VRIVLLYITVFISLSSSGQVASLNDTIRIDEVIVNGRTSLSGSGSNAIFIDSTVLKNYSHDNISEVISENTSIFIKNYGSGGIATISLRGTGAGYTQLAWNGISINSPMLGQTDLTLIPAGFVDDLNVLTGGASLVMNNGGIGGIINLETKPAWKEKTNLIADVSAGSFGRYSSLVKVKLGNSGFQSSTKVLIQSAENNFTYQNNFISSDPVTEQRKNAAVNQKSVMQELYFRKEKNVLSARFWYENTNRNIPVPIVTQQPENGEYQHDEAFRSMIQYSGYSGKTDYSSSFSWFSEKLSYLNPLLSVNSKNLSNTLIFKSGFNRNINRKTNFNLFVNNEFNLVNSVNYAGLKSRNLASITASLKKLIGERMCISVLLRPAIKDRNILVPDFSAGLDYSLSASAKQLLKINISRNSKVPTLNDLYWNPGGNEFLMNEYSYTGELGYEVTANMSQTISFNSQVSAYMISIINMIKWVPGQAGYWSPSNISKAQSSGIEGNAGITYTSNDIRLRIFAKYAWNHAQIIKSLESDFIKGKQIVYVPENMLNAGIRTVYKKFYMTLLSCYTGKRYTNADNSASLRGYLINNVSTGVKIGSGKSSFDLSFKADNIFNVSYQTVAWYPMPGRSFMLSFIYQFNNNKENE